MCAYKLEITSYIEDVPMKVPESRRPKCYSTDDFITPTITNIDKDDFFYSFRSELFALEVAELKREEEETERLKAFTESNTNNSNNKCNNFNNNSNQDYCDVNNDNDEHIVEKDDKDINTITDKINENINMNDDKNVVLPKMNNNNVVSIVNAGPIQTTSSASSMNIEYNKPSNTVVDLNKQVAYNQVNFNNNNSNLNNRNNLVHQYVPFTTNSIENMNHSNCNQININNVTKDYLHYQQPFTNIIMSTNTNDLNTNNFVKNITKSELTASTFTSTTVPANLPFSTISQETPKTNLSALPNETIKTTTMTTTSLPAIKRVNPADFENSNSSPFDDALLKAFDDKHELNQVFQQVYSVKPYTQYIPNLTLTTSAQNHSPHTLQTPAPQQSITHHNGYINSNYRASTMRCPSSLPQQQKFYEQNNFNYYNNNNNQVYNKLAPNTQVTTPQINTYTNLPYNLEQHHLQQQQRNQSITKK